MKHLGFFYKPVCPIQTEVVNIIIAVKIIFQSSFSHNIDVLECISSVAKHSYFLFWKVKLVEGGLRCFMLSVDENL